MAEKEEWAGRGDGKHVPRERSDEGVQRCFVLVSTYAEFLW